MAVTNPYQAYRQNSVTTASPGDLTLMLYNGCLKFILQAKNAIELKKIEDKNINIQKAQKIIQELMVTLNMEFPVSQSLMPLYDYMNRRLVEANIKNDIVILNEVEEMVTEFRDTWKEAIKINRQKQHGSVDNG
ncbi:flagellar export chaperone FliS [Niallia sp. MER 6]|uniref:flagellar export chaperone FliS n=1 Tax=Niallia sp. MER 6 TaxID=2939567 RepID=UPI00203BC849|nr:flagellar export chaperone FliS [Niallia sp. MER 6]MCM3029675.1 flagellar export chaperone FliS [Niallia sp. MER 6]